MYRRLDRSSNPFLLFIDLARDASLTATIDRNCSVAVLRSQLRIVPLLNLRNYSHLFNVSSPSVEEVDHYQ
jgi:hypothetical protein